MRCSPWLTLDKIKNRSSYFTCAMGPAKLNRLYLEALSIDKIVICLDIREESRPLIKDLAEKGIGSEDI